MRPYFEKMAGFGKELKENRIIRSKESRAKLEAVEAEITAARKARQDAGIPAAKINERGMLTIWQRLEYLVDAGSWCPLHSLYNPEDNPEGATNVVDGIGKISGRWAVIVGFDNRCWPAPGCRTGREHIAGDQSAKRLHIPLVWLVNCSGVQCPSRKFYDRRGSVSASPPRRARAAASVSGRHLRHQSGRWRLSGYQHDHSAGAHEANIASAASASLGMSPKGLCEGLEELIAKTRNFSERPPGGVETHYGETGFPRMYNEEKVRRHQAIHARDPGL